MAPAPGDERRPSRCRQGRPKKVERDPNDDETPEHLAAAPVAKKQKTAEMLDEPTPDGSTPALATAPERRNNDLRSEWPPINNVDEAFRDLLKRALDQEAKEPLPDLLSIAKDGGFKINVSTMCSGTDAPIFALKMLATEFFALTGVELFRFHQQFAVEIEPYKQSYIRRNTDAVVFRDVRDFASKDLSSKQVMTALGSKSQVPYDRPHILIVGTSCVSFSNLNTAKQKNFGGAAAAGLHDYLEKMRAEKQDADHSQVGEYLIQIVESLDMSSESDATFFPVLSFILHQRPTFVIFENVLDAPWPDMQNIFLPAVGYSAAFASCDTKNYYLPQTRKRKYLVAFDNLEFGKEKARTMAEDTMKFLVQFRRRASVDVERFLYENTDKATQLDIQQLEFERNSKTATREAPWFFSQQRHEKVRQDEKLGYGHPFSGLKPTGEHTFYDRANKTIMNRQSNRVKEVTDISLLRGLTAMPSFDSRFKTKVYDHSQNVDRNTGPIPSGVSGCLTPNGLAFISNQSRYVTGREYLQLQGLPVNALSLSRETTDQLKNLAGNAMTTTVVGATFLSAIMAMRKNDPRKRKQFPRIDLNDERYKGALSSVPEPAIATSTLERVCDIDLSSYVEATTGEILDLAQRIRPYCYCTGTAMYSSAILWKCQTCDTIRCGNCKGNPKHEYEKLELVPEAFGQETAELMLMLHLPKVLQNVFSANLAGKLLKNLDKSWQVQSDHDDVSSMLQNEVFYFNRVHRSETISVSYTSSSGFELKVMVDASSVTWYLLIDAHSTIGKKMAGDSSNKSPSSILLETSSKPTGQRLREFCLRGLPIARAQITDRSLASIPTDQQWVPWIFEKPSRTFNGSEVPNIQVSVEKDDGVLTIDLIPEETSFATSGVLKMIQSVLGSWEPKPDCDVAESSLYVRKDNDDSEKLFLFKDPSRIGPVELDTFVVSKNPRIIQWHEHREVMLSFVPLATTDQKTDKDRPGKENIERLQLATQIDAGTSVCDEDNRVLAEMTISRETSAVSILQKLAWRCDHVDGNGFVTVDKADHDSFFKAIAFALHGLIGSMEPLSTSCIEGKLCEACSPSTPAVHWVSKSDESNFLPIHMVEDVGRYESALREHEPALKVMAKVSSDQAHVEIPCMSVKLTVNPSRLAHRALSYLPRINGKLAGRDSPVRLKMFIEPGHSDSLVFNLKPFSASINQPARIPGASPISQPLHFPAGMLLDPKQLVTVDYMIRREKSPAVFTEREDEEEVLEGLPLRVVGRAERDVSCGGGIIADKVGAGKTVMTLALISYQTDFDRAKYARRAKREAEDGTKALQATLIIVPKHIISQWASEIAKFLPGLRKTEVLRLETTKELFTTTPEALSEAKIVIASDSLWRENSYREELARFAATPSITKPYRQRPYREWYNTSVQALRGFLGRYLQPGASQNDRMDLAYAINDAYSRWQEQNQDWVNGIVKPGGRKIAKGKKAPAKKTNATLKPRVDVGPQLFFDHKPILEHFSFARIVWDEVSYENLEVGQFMSISMSDHKWLLSGTPPRQTLDDVASLAHALGMSLARTVDLRAGLPLITNVPTETDRTETETCMSYGRLKSDRFVKDRHEQAERFLRTFSVSSEAAELKIQTHGHAIICAPTPVEKSIYLERQQVWRCAQMNLEFLDKDILHEMLRTIGYPRATAAPHDLSSRTLSYAASLPTFGQADNFSPATVAANRQKVLDGTVEYLVQLIDQLLWLAHRLEKLAPAKPNTEKAKDAEGESGGIDTFRLYLYRLGRFHHQFFGGKSAHIVILKALFEDSAMAPPNKVLERQAELKGINLADLFSNKMTSGPLAIKDNFLQKLFEARNVSWTKFYRVEKALVDKLDRTNLIELLEELTSRNLYAMTESGLRDELRAHLDDIISEQDAFRRSHAIRDADEQQAMLKTKTKGELSAVARMRGLKYNPSMKKDDILRMIELHDKGGAGYSKYLMGTDIRALVAAEPPPMMGSSVRKRGANHSETENLFKELWNLFLNALNVLIIHNDSANRTKMFDRFTRNSKFICSGCKGDTMLKVNLLCGHVLCENCLREPCGDGHRGSGCKSPVEGNVVDMKDLSAAPRSLATHNIASKSAQPSKQPSKLKCIIDLIRHIPQDDKIVVFTQHVGMIQSLLTALKEEGIAARTTTMGLQDARGKGTSRATTTAGTAGKNVEDFKNGKYQVLVLKVDAAEAAGSNLTVANHVIFATPLAVSAQDKYESYMEQAKGRCARRGQERDVHIYHCAVENTIEVDMIETRTKKHTRVQPGRSLGWLVPRGLPEAEVSQMNDYSPSHSESARVNSILKQNEVWKALGEVDHGVIRGFTDTSYVKEAEVDFSNLALRTVAKNKGGQATETTETRDGVTREAADELPSIVKEEENGSEVDMADGEEFRVYST